MANEEDGTFYAAKTENGSVYLAGSWEDVYKRT